MDIIFVDPIGQMLGYYDYRICLSLARSGHRVVLATTEDSYTHRQGKVPFGVDTLFERTDSNSGKLGKGLSYIKSLWRLSGLAGKSTPMTFCFQYNLFPPADLLFTLWCRVRKHKVVLFAHDILPLDQKFYHKFLYTLLYRAVDKLMVFARVNMERVISELGVDARKVELKSLGNFLRPARNSGSRREARESLGISEDDRVALFFGQIKKSKGLDHLIRAFAEVIQTEPRAMLVIAGRPQGVELSLFTDLIREYSLGDRVILDARYIPDEEIPRYFASADLVALPYTELYQSAVLMLACSHATPVVATNVGGMSEVISDGSTGYLVPPGDEKELAAAIVKAFRNPKESRRMGREARRLMEQRYSWDRYTRELEEVLVKT